MWRLVQTYRAEVVFWTAFNFSYCNRRSQSQVAITDEKARGGGRSSDAVVTSQASVRLGFGGYRADISICQVTPYDTRGLEVSSFKIGYYVVWTYEKVGWILRKCEAPCAGGIERYQYGSDWVSRLFGDCRAYIWGVPVPVQSIYKYSGGEKKKEFSAGPNQRIPPNWPETGLTRAVLLQLATFS